MTDEKQMRKYMSEYNSKIALQDSIPRFDAVDKNEEHESIPNGRHGKRKISKQKRKMIKASRKKNRKKRH